MSRQYRNHYKQANHSSMRFRFSDPFGYQRRAEAGMKRDLNNQVFDWSRKMEIRYFTDANDFLSCARVLLEKTKPSGTSDDCRSA